MPQCICKLLLCVFSQLFHIFLERNWAQCPVPTLEKDFDESTSWINISPSPVAPCARLREMKWGSIRSTVWNGRQTPYVKATRGKDKERREGQHTCLRLSEFSWVNGLCHFHGELTHLMWSVYLCVATTVQHSDLYYITTDVTDH